MMPRPPDALVDEAIRCPCTAGGKPWCARCECLIQLALARDVWTYEQVTGRSWWQTLADQQYEEAQALKRIGGLRGLGYAILGWLCEGCAVAYYVCWVLPLTAWLHYTGRIPPPPTLCDTRLPVRLRERAWCTVCQRTLEPGTVRCPVHPEGEVMLVLRDEERTS